MSQTIVRFPPSPTGLLHIGTVRTCLYNYLFAKQKGGKIIMRLEDTDKERSTEEYAENIMSGLKKLGIAWDNGPVKQSERSEIYKKYLQQLIDEGKAYYCFCTAEELNKIREQQQKEKKAPKYPGIWRDRSPEEIQEKLEAGEKYVIRFRVPEDRGEITFQDHVRGEVKIHTKELDDFVIAKNFETALYNFVVVIDDHEMNISDVIRGEDHISNTPKQILVYEAFGWNPPHFGHLPLILNQDKSKLSKRKNKVSVDDYLAEGFLSEALINFLALLGWNTSDEKEIFSIEELTKEFSLHRVQKGAAIFDIERLTWMNGTYIRKKTLLEIKELLLPYLQEQVFIEGREKYGEEFFEKAINMIHERLKKLSEAADFLRFFFVSEENFSPDAELFAHKKMKVDNQLAKENLEKSLKVLEKISEENWTQAFLEEKLIALVQELGVKNGQVLWPIRVAITAEKFTPGAFEILEALGKKRSIQRIEKSISVL